MGRAERWFNALEGLRWQRAVVSRSSGKLLFATKQVSLSALGPRATSGARPVVMNRRNSLPPLHEMTTVQAPRPYSVSGADGRWRHSGERKMSVMNRRNSLPPLHEMTTVQVPRPYSVSGADGRLRHSGEGRKGKGWGGESAGSTLWKAVVCSGQPSPEAPGNFCLQREKHLSALGGPRPAFRRSRRRPQAAGIHFRR